MVRIISNNNNNEVKEDDDNVSKDEGEERVCMKKGPWTPTEDTMLIEYVEKHGEGNWNSVQKNSGLLRCGKSCRLRWANHLRPNLKKGAFSEEEEKIIIDLHAKLGNKWAQMAAQLPGRTDNEIKNFWNTRMKRRQRAGLPLYPPEVQEEAITYHLQQQRYFEQPFSSSPSFSLLLSSCYPKKLNEPTHFSAVNPPQNQPNSSSCYTNPSGNANPALPLSPISPYGSSSSSTLFNQSFATNNADPLDHQCSGSYIHSLNTNSTIPVVQGSNTEISSSQSPTPASSYASGVDELVGASSMVNDYYEVAPLSPQGNSGLLDAVVLEAQSLSRNDNSKSDDSNSTFARLSHKRKNMAVEEYVDNEEVTTVLLEPSMKKNTRDTSIGTQRVSDLSSSQLSTEKELVATDPSMEEMNSMDDDLFSLLNNFPSETPTLEWYRKGENQSLGLETQVDASLGPTDQESAWSLGSYSNNIWLAYA